MPPAGSCAAEPPPPQGSPSALFAVYIANFSHYNKICGSLARVIIFLTLMWISNVAILLGAEFNAELERSRAVAGGHPPGKAVDVSPNPGAPSRSNLGGDFRCARLALSAMAARGGGRSRTSPSQAGVPRWAQV
jgi:hypothetical protein